MSHCRCTIALSVCACVAVADYGIPADLPHIETPDHVPTHWLTNLITTSATVTLASLTPGGLFGRPI